MKVGMRAEANPTPALWAEKGKFPLTMARVNQEGSEKTEWREDMKYHFTNKRMTYIHFQQEMKGLLPGEIN